MIAISDTGYLVLFFGGMALIYVVLGILWLRLTTPEQRKQQAELTRGYWPDDDDDDDVELREAMLKYYKKQNGDRYP